MTSRSSTKMRRHEVSTVYIAQCITCHGTRARGGDRGADLVRSLVVLHDRYGSTIGPYLAQGHPAGQPVTLTQQQIVDLSHFLHQQVGDTCEPDLTTTC